MRFIADLGGCRDNSLSRVDHRKCVVQAIRHVGQLVRWMESDSGRMAAHGDLRDLLPTLRVDNDHRVSGLASYVEFGAGRVKRQSQRVLVGFDDHGRLGSQGMGNLLHCIVEVEWLAVCFGMTWLTCFGRDRFETGLFGGDLITHHRIVCKQAPSPVTGFAADPFIQVIRIGVPARGIMIGGRMAAEAGGLGQRVAFDPHFCSDFLCSWRAQAGVCQRMRPRLPQAELVTHRRRFVTLCALDGADVLRAVGLGRSRILQVVWNFPFLRTGMFQQFPGFIHVVFLGLENSDV